MEASARATLPYYAKPLSKTNPNAPPTHPRPLRHILPPSSSSSLEHQSISAHLLNQLDLQQHQFNHLYTRTTHIVPSASPRTLSKGPLAYPTSAPGEDATSRKVRVYEVGSRILKRKQAYEKGEAVEGVEDESVEPQLFNVLDRYTLSEADTWMTTGRTGLTLFLAHANGFPKRVRDCQSSSHLMTQCAHMFQLHVRYGSPCLGTCS